jgi:hypothetical protein
VVAIARERIRRLDLKPRLAFEALMAERNVTQAAERMSVGQSAMSGLRAFFGDEKGAYAAKAGGAASSPASNNVLDYPFAWT